MRLISADVLVWPPVEGTKKTLCIVKFRSGAATLLVAARADCRGEKIMSEFEKKILQLPTAFPYKQRYLLLGIFHQAL